MTGIVTLRSSGHSGGGAGLGGGGAGLDITKLTLLPGAALLS
jgi:hypothetical protein